MRLHQDGKNIGIMYDSTSPFRVLQAGLTAAEMDTNKGDIRSFFTPLHPIGDETEEEYDDLTRPRKAHKNKWTSSQDAISWVNLGKHLIEDCSLGKPDLTPSSFMTQCQLTALKKWDTPEETRFLYQKDSNATTSSESCIEECLTKCSTTNNQATSNHVLRETSSKWISVCEEYNPEQNLSSST